MKIEQFKENILTMAIRNMDFLENSESIEDIVLLSVHTFHIVRTSNKFGMFELSYKILNEHSKATKRLMNKF